MTNVIATRLMMHKIYIINNVSTLQRILPVPVKLSTSLVQLVLGECL